MSQTNFTPEQKERLIAWAKELIFGNHMQGTGRLAFRWKPDGPVEYCCLGVACEVAIAHGVPVVREERPRSDGTVVIAYDGGEDFLPDSVQQWYGLDRANPILRVPNGEHGILEATASDLNDNDTDLDEALDFREIALAILRTFQLGEINSEYLPGTTETT